MSIARLSIRRPPLGVSYRSVRFASTSIPQPPAPANNYTPKPVDPPAVSQAPNVPETWSTSQTPKKLAFDNARFEQTQLEMQPNSLAAIQMTAQDPIRMVNSRRASCDGGGGPLGHPKVYINLDKPGPKACGYCGIRFEQAHAAH